MTWLRRARPVLIVVGGLLLVGSLLGARLFGTGGTGPDTPQTANPSAGKFGSGPVVIGFVDSDPPKIEYGLPPILQSGQVVEVAVKEGQHVKAGDILFRFDASVWEGKLKTAEKAVKV